MCKLQRKTLFCLPCSKNIFKFKNTVEKPKTVEHCGGATVIDPELVIAINHSILGIFQNFKMEWKLDFVSYILLVELKFKKYHFNGRNRISAAAKTDQPKLVIQAFRG